MNSLNGTNWVKVTLCKGQGQKLDFLLHTLPEEKNPKTVTHFLFNIWKDAVFHTDVT